MRDNPTDPYGEPVPSPPFPDYSTINYSVDDKHNAKVVTLPTFLEVVAQWAIAQEYDVARVDAVMVRTRNSDAGWMEVVIAYTDTSDAAELAFVADGDSLVSLWNHVMAAWPS